MHPRTGLYQKTEKIMTNKAQHTPGPWEVLQVCDDVYIECANLDEKSVKTICALNKKSDYANAALIAAAPDLLAALERCYKVFKMDDVDTSISMQVGMAISKAKGAA